MNIKLELTADGSHTLLNAELDESYHVFKGALTESVYVYIDAGLRPLYQALAQNHVPRLAPKQASAQIENPASNQAISPAPRQANGTGPALRILEVGFGTGLNVLLTAQVAQQLGGDIQLTTLEPCPIGAELVASLNHPDCLAALGGYGELDELRVLLTTLHQAPWDTRTQIGSLSLHKIQSKLELQRFAPGSFDLVYFDAFAPKKQPELWAADNFSKLYNALDAQGLLVSYCANGQFKRDLKAAGFRVESYPGPMGRRHMTRAWKGL